MAPDIVLIGPYGSGKTTQAQLIARRDGLVYFNAGQALRNYLETDAPERRALKEAMHRGELLPPHHTVNFLEELFHENPGARFVIDGLPRSMDQVELFEEMMARHRREYVVVHITLSDEESFRRQVERLVCPKCHAVYVLGQAAACANDGAALIERPENDQAVARRRIGIFHAETNPVIAHYRGRLVEVNGEQDVESVAADIKRLVE